MQLQVWIKFTVPVFQLFIGVPYFEWKAWLSRLPDNNGILGVIKKIFIEIICLVFLYFIQLIRFNAAITECFFLFPSLFTFWPVVVNYFFVVEIYIANLVFIISLTSVQIYIQIVPLCDCNNNNIRKQVYVAFEHGQQVSKDKFILQRHLIFNLTRILPKFNLFERFALHMHKINVLCIWSLSCVSVTQ